MKKNRINLIPKQHSSFGVREVSFERALTVGVIALVGMMLLPSAMLYSKTKNAEARRNALQSEAARMATEIGSYGPAESTGFPAELGSLSAVIRSKQRWAEPFKELSALIPSKVWIFSSSHSVEAGKRKVRITGMAPSQDKVNDFFAALEGSVYYRNIMIRLSEKSAEFFPQLYKFEFTAEMNDSAPKAASR